MSSQRHIIRRQTIELGVSQQSAAVDLQRRASQVCRQRLIPLIEAYCNRHSSTDSLLRIDTLELDLGALSTASLEDELVAAVDRLLPQALTREIERQDRARADGDIPPRVLAQLELVALFMQTGNLPWWADRSQSRVVAAAVERLLIEAPEPLADLVRGLACDSAQLARLVEHASEQSLAKLCALLDPEVTAACPGLPRELLAVFGRVASLAAVPAAQRRAVVWRAVIFLASQPGTADRRPLDFVRDLFLIAAARFALPYRTLVAAAHDTLSSRESGAMEAVVAALDREARGEPSGAPVDEPRTRPDPGTVSRARTDLQFSDADAIDIDNSGLVLLWPFLEHFFEHLGLVAGKRFVTPAAVQRGIGLLGFLATLDPEPIEYLLPLCKVLCGLDPDGRFEFGPPVTPAEADECVRLLTAVIEQAPILKTMSLDGLRGTFLLRPGVLSARDGSWLVRVERETYDVVLERFPWSWEWIRLPWMSVPLRVEWI